MKRMEYFDYLKREGFDIHDYKGYPLIKTSDIPPKDRVLFEATITKKHFFGESSEDLERKQAEHLADNLIRLAENKGFCTKIPFAIEEMPSFDATHSTQTGRFIQHKGLMRNMEFKPKQ